MSIIQEKYQIELPGKMEAGESWVSAKSANRGRSAGSKLNEMPPGMDILRQKNSRQNEQILTRAGSTDVSNDVENESLNRGYSKKQMRPTDDMYTREHNDAFYDDVGGFVERNNVLDRS